MQENTAKLQVTRFSTGALPSEQRHEAWLARDLPSISRVYKTDPQEPFNVSSETLALGELSINYADITAQHWTREKSLRRSWHPDGMVVALTLEGETQGDWNGRTARTSAGTLQVADLALPSEHISTRSKTILVNVPRAIAYRHGIDPAQLHGQAMRSGLVNFFSAHLQSLRQEAAHLPAGAAPDLARSVMALLQTALSHGMGTDPVAERADLAILARTLIEKELASSRLSIAALCRSLGISRSTLHRLFSQEGGVGAYIRERRLQLAHDAIRSSKQPLHIIAERFAFSDGAHLSRLYKARFGQTPGAMRKDRKADIQN